MRCKQVVCESFNVLLPTFFFFLPFLIELVSLSTNKVSLHIWMLQTTPFCGGMCVVQSLTILVEELLGPTSSIYVFGWAIGKKVDMENGNM